MWVLPKVYACIIVWMLPVSQLGGKNLGEVAGCGGMFQVCVCVCFKTSLFAGTETLDKFKPFSEDAG